MLSLFWKGVQTVNLLMSVRTWFKIHWIQKCLRCDLITRLCVMIYRRNVCIFTIVPTELNQNSQKNLLSLFFLSPLKPEISFASNFLIQCKRWSMVKHIAAYKRQCKVMWCNGGCEARRTGQSVVYQGGSNSRHHLASRPTFAKV